mmetsp:Transcript_3079/g.9032  ORF Transcript_3079/g.9032 Transcript_3079/m.9032 type:complete len:409 (-) Transcript_3079:843-2069(-)
MCFQYQYSILRCGARVWGDVKTKEVFLWGPITALVRCVEGPAATDSAGSRHAHEHGVLPARARVEHRAARQLRPLNQRRGGLVLAAARAELAHVADAPRVQVARARDDQVVRVAAHDLVAGDAAERRHERRRRLLLDAIAQAELVVVAAPEGVDIAASGECEGVVLAPGEHADAEPLQAAEQGRGARLVWVERAEAELAHVVEAARVDVLALGQQEGVVRACKRRLDLQPVVEFKLLRLPLGDGRPVLEVQRRRFSRVPRRVLLEPRLDPIAKVLVEHPRVTLVQARAGRGGQPQRARRARRSELLLVRLLGRPLLLVHRLAALVAAPRVHLVPVRRHDDRVVGARGDGARSHAGKDAPRLARLCEVGGVADVPVRVLVGAPGEDAAVPRQGGRVVVAASHTLHRHAC